MSRGHTCRVDGTLQSTFWSANLQQMFLQQNVTGSCDHSMFLPTRSMTSRCSAFPSEHCRYIIQNHRYHLLQYRVKFAEGACLFAVFQQLFIVCSGANDLLAQSLLLFLLSQQPSDGCMSILLALLQCLVQLLLPVVIPATASRHQHFVISHAVDQEHWVKHTVQQGHISLTSLYSP